MILWADLETYCEVPINHGTFAYAQKAEVMLFAYAIDDGPSQVWDKTHHPFMPQGLHAALETAEAVWFHNAMFDRTVLQHAMSLVLPVERTRCTMAQAYAHSLPGSLDKLCEVLNVAQDQRKLKTGKQLVQLFCKPRPKNSKTRRATRGTHPAEWAQFVEYARMDIDAMRACHKKMPKWNYSGSELDLYHLDQTINARGFAVDLDLAHAAVAAVAREQERLAAETVDRTDGAVTAATQRDALLEHILAYYGVDLPDMQASTLERRISDPDLPLELRELLAIRLQATTTSTSKYHAVIRGATGGRMRGTLQFCGASRTGRWAGRQVQPQNFPRPTMKPAAIEGFIDALKAGVADVVYLNVMDGCANAIRGVIVAGANRKLVVVDKSNIEGRMLAWLAGETWKIQAYADYDAGAGPDLYNVAYGRAFGVDPDEVDSEQRQIGKVMELALGYEGGVGAFVTFAAVYRVDLEALAASAWDTFPDDARGDAEDFYAWTLKNKRPTFGLSREAFVACDTFKRLWRSAHPNVARFWKDCRDNFTAAVNNPGNTFKTGYLKFYCSGAWLRIVLPSGRSLCYPSPRVGGDGTLSYMGVDQYSRQWSRIKTYGGKLVENITQAASRDALTEDVRAAEMLGYPVVLTVHDEILSEPVDAPEFNHKSLAALMSRGYEWAPGLPLAAKGFEGQRYRKD